MMRVFHNSTYDRWMIAGCPPPGKRPGEHAIITEFSPERPVERYSYCMPAPIMKGDLEPLVHYAGQSVGLVKNKKSVSEILDEVIDEAWERIYGLQVLIK